MLIRKSARGIFCFDLGEFARQTLSVCEISRGLLDADELEKQICRARSGSRRFSEKK